MINLNFSLVIAFLYVLILYAFMNRFFFQPILAILHERRRLIQGRVEEAQKRIAEVEQKAADYDAALRAARSEAYREQEAERERALAEKSQLIAEAKQKADQAVKEGRERIAAEAATVRSRLEANVDEMARRLTTSVLRD